MSKIYKKTISFFYKLLFFLTPLIFLPFTSEVFEFNKLVFIYFSALTILFLWILRSLTERKIIFSRTILDLPLLFFILSQAVSTYFSIDTRTSIFGYYSRFNGGLLSSTAYSVLYWGYVSNIANKESRVMLRNAIFSGLILSLWAGFEHFGKSPSCFILKGEFGTDCWVQDVTHRAFASFGQPNWLAAWLVTITALSFLMFKGKLSILIFGLIYSAVLFTKSRSGVLGFLIAYLVYLFLTRKRVAFLGIFIIAIISAVFGTPWTNSVITKDRAYKKPSADVLITESSDIRKIIWRGAFDIFRDYPLFGSGVETFAFSYYKYRPVEHNLTSEWNYIYNKAHNEYLNYLATTGIFGFLAYMLIVAASIKMIVVSKSDYKNALLAGYLGLLITNFFGFSVVSTSVTFFLYPALCKKNDNSKDKVLKIKKGSIAFGMSFLTIAYIFGLVLIARYFAADIYYAKATKSLSRKNYAESEYFFNKALGLNNEPLYWAHFSSASSAKALDEFLSGIDYQESAANAEYASEKAFSQSPRNIKILQIISNSYADMSQIDGEYLLKSIEILERMIDLSPTDPRNYYVLALSYARTGNFEKAIEHLKKACLLKPDYEKAFVLLSVLYAQRDGH